MDENGCTFTELGGPLRDSKDRLLWVRVVGESERRRRPRWEMRQRVFRIRGLQRGYDPGGMASCRGRFRLDVGPGWILR